MAQLTEKPKRTYHHGDLRHALVMAAATLIEEKGPDNFSVAEAARTAGVSTAAPYKHFADRDEMMMAVCLAWMDEEYAAFGDAVADLPKGSPQRISAIGRVYVQRAVATPNTFRMCFGLAAAHDEFEIAVEKGDRLFGLVVQEVADVLGPDCAVEEARQRAFMLWSFVHGVSFLLIDGKVSSMGLEFDIEHFLADVGARVLFDPQT